MFNQYNDFKKPAIKKDSFVAVDIIDDVSVPMQLDMVFPRCPCPCKSRLADPV